MTLDEIARELRRRRDDGFNAVEAFEVADALLAVIALLIERERRDGE